MTEIAGAAAVKAASHVASAATNALKSSDLAEQALLDAAKDTPEWEVGAIQYARRTALKERMKTAMFEKLGFLFGIRRDYFENQFLDDLAPKMDSIPDENLAEPSPSLLAQTVEALGYSVDEPTLKEMYLDLIASAWDDRVLVHPSFPTIIKQLDPAEAASLQGFITQQHLAVVSLRQRSLTPAPGSGGHEVVRNLVSIVDSDTGEMAEVPEFELWMDNWVRQGLFELRSTSWLTADDAYAWVETRPEYLRAKELAESQDSEVTISKAVLVRTALGAAFAEATGARAAVDAVLAARSGDGVTSKVADE